MSKIKKKNFLATLKILKEANNTAKEIQLVPYGWVETNKGNFLVDELSIRAILDACSKRTNDLVVDYEHQTLNGGIAPAAGWIKDLLDKGKDGLWAVVEWTPKAAEFIQNKEYRYISPVLWIHDADQRAIELHSAALTNDPAIDGMAPLAAKNIEYMEDDEEMKQLALKLGLPENATVEQILQAIETLQSNSAKLVANSELLSLLDLPENANLLDAKAKVIALKNPAGYVKAEEFQALKNKYEKRERDDLVQVALKSGKITPAQKEWAEKYALQDPEGFKAFTEQAPVVVQFDELAPDDTSTETGKGAGKLDEAQLSVNKLFGITDEQYKKVFGGEA